MRHTVATVRTTLITRLSQYKKHEGKVAQSIEPHVFVTHHRETQQREVSCRHTHMERQVVLLPWCDRSAGARGYGARGQSTVIEQGGGEGERKEQCACTRRSERGGREAVSLCPCQRLVGSDMSDGRRWCGRTETCGRGQPDST